MLGTRVLLVVKRAHLKPLLSSMVRSTSFQGIPSCHFEVCSTSSSEEGTFMTKRATHPLICSLQAASYTTMQHYSDVTHVNLSPHLTFEKKFLKTWCGELLSGGN